MQCWERLCTQLAGHMDCQETWDANLPCSVRISMTGCISQRLCMRGLVNPSLWISQPVYIHLITAAASKQFRALGWQANVLATVQPHKQHLGL